MVGKYETWTPEQVRQHQKAMLDVLYGPKGRRLSWYSCIDEMSCHAFKEMAARDHACKEMAARDHACKEMAARDHACKEWRRAI